MKNQQINRISPQQIRDWLESPVSRRLTERLERAKKHSLDGMTQSIMNTPDQSILGHETMGQMIGYKAQIQTIEELLDLETFLSDEEIEDEE